MRFLRLTCVLVLGISATMLVQKAGAQTFGIDLHNAMMPASGGMA